MPPSDRDKYKEMVDAFFASKPDFAGGNDNTAKFEEHMGHMARMTDYIGEHVAERRRHPREDLLPSSSGPRSTGNA